MRFVVGLGNCGKQYEKTRHNIGFRILDKWAENNGLRFKKEPVLEGEYVLASIAGRQTALIKPLTFMNGSGRAVSRFLQFYKGNVEEVLVITDDVSLPFGAIRFRKEGSAGGHNGLKDIESHLKTQSYCRLKIGVGDRIHGTLADYVLGRFSEEEEKGISQIVSRSIECVEMWLKGNLGEQTWHVI